MKRLEHSAATVLELLRRAVAASPILVASRLAPATIVPDWENVRRSGDVDAVVLAWIASHARGGGQRRTH